MGTDFSIVDWTIIKLKLQKEFPGLSKADFLWRQGTKEDVLRAIAGKLGKTRKELGEVIEKV